MSAVVAKWGCAGWLVGLLGDLGIECELPGRASSEAAVCGSLPSDAVSGSGRVLVGSLHGVSVGLPRCEFGSVEE